MDILKPRQKGSNPRIRLKNDTIMERESTLGNEIEKSNPAAFICLMNIFRDSEQQPVTKNR
ncbi:MAG TPA: hypothetical protein VN367_08445 [Chlorobaculum sp.]|nr:hypothetical protein [Chlorobaculum sp.]